MSNKEIQNLNILSQYLQKHLNTHFSNANVITIKSIFEFKAELDTHSRNPSTKFKDWFIKEFLNDPYKSINLFDANTINQKVGENFQIQDVAQDDTILYYIDRFQPEIKFDAYQIDLIYRQIQKRLEVLNAEDELIYDPDKPRSVKF